MPAATAWVAVTERVPGEHCPPLLVTNNMRARDAFGHMSHVWVVMMLHKQSDGSFCAFDGNIKIFGITHWSEIAPLDVDAPFGTMAK